MRTKGLLIALATVCGMEFAAAPVLGDGGTLRFSGRRGGRSVTVFTSPAPLCAGPVDLSVLVLDVKSGKPIPTLPVAVRAQLIGHPETAIGAEATTHAATNKLLRAATLEVSALGRWHFEVSVESVPSSPPIGFDAEIADLSPLWLDLSLWIAWPVLPIALFVLHQLRLRHATSRSTRLRQ
jgi:hypothetical protein